MNRQAPDNGLRPAADDGRWDVYLSLQRIAQLHQRDPTHIQYV